ncbi:hypothetical protein CWATWH8502_148 [Crocosphaera watsonii WH 8502]|uniref:Uncharacterized protein n=1 Tax=Crocosphaera watsonii WH 8502 TaxID=423474 RepID=T2I7S7_CROWT|nr:hypothetical protein CWATWH8502_148 [Crocosphaera watsonii WH 8502]
MVINYINLRIIHDTLNIPPLVPPFVRGVRGDQLSLILTTEN